MGGVTRAIQTAYHINGGIFICGIQPKPTEERVSLTQDFHPGFGMTALLKNGKEVWTCGPSDKDKSRNLSWLEKNIIAKTGTTKTRWTFEVHGPMVSYILTRRAPKLWVLSKSMEGFA